MPLSHFHHYCCQPHPYQLLYTAITNALLYHLHQHTVRDVIEVALDVYVNYPIHLFTSNCLVYPVCIASCILRFGRNPYELSRKSASKIGSMTIFVTICTTRSRTVGIPSGRKFPSPFGISCLRTPVCLLHEPSPAFLDEPFFSVFLYV